MANPNNPFGFIPVKHLNGGDSTQTQTKRLASGYGTSIYTGDLVKLVSGKIERCEATDTPDGVFMGCQYTDSNGEVQYENTWVAGTTTKGGVDAKARVISDKQVVYKAQFTGTPTVGSIGSSFTISTTAGEVDGRSKIGVTTTTTSGIVRLHDFLDDAENEVGEFAIGLFTLD
jgi:hypothetical protein